MRMCQWYRHLLCIAAVSLALSTAAPGGKSQFSSHLPGSYFNRGTNAAWLGSEWISKPHEKDEIEMLARDLARRQIQCIYVFASYLGPSAEFTSTYSYAADFVHSIKAVQPRMSVQAWIGLPLTWPSSGGSIEKHGVDLSDSSMRERIAAFGLRLVRQYGFDGIHLDPEPVADGNDAVLALLDQIRQELGTGPTLSIAARRIWPAVPGRVPPMCRQLFWSGGYYREVAAHVDQVALMTYDSALPLPQGYRLWGRLQAVAVTRALEGMDVELFIGIPTSEEKTWTHWPNAENMTTGLLGLVDGLNDPAARPGVLTGVAIYPYWETDTAEWKIYESLWLGREE